MKEIINKALKESLVFLPESLVKESMEYSLLNGGKRLRSQVLLSILKDYNVDINSGLPFACSLEMIHTYSLVHDDLPAMDDDDYRRHKLTNHKVYGEATAILAGDALLTYAFENACRSSLKAETVLACIEVLARNSGADGMILGQELDIDNQMKNLDDLLISYEYKTGRLFSIAFETAVLIADKQEKQSLAASLGIKLGVLFQVQDDLLEYTHTFEEIGKDTSSDQNEDKVTVVTLLGIEEANNLKDKLVTEFYADLKLLELEGNNLLNIINEIVDRQY